jgi:integrase
MATKVADAIPLFLESLTGRGLTPGTLRRHTSALLGVPKSKTSLLAAAEAVKGPSVTMGQVDHLVVARYLAATTGGQGNRNNRLESARQFIGWADQARLLRPGIRAENILVGYKYRKYQRKLKYYIPAADFPRALDIAGERDPRDRAVVAFLLGTLARDSEAKGTTLKHLDLDSLSVDLWREKRKRWTTTGCNPDLADEMAQWGDRYAREMDYPNFRAMRAAHPDWHLLPPRTEWNMGSALIPSKGPTTLPRVVKRVLTGLGVTETEHTEATRHVGEGVHTIRRSGARALYENLLIAVNHDSALSFVQSMLDHEHPEMTMAYIGKDWHRDQLNAWLRGNRMYANQQPGGDGAEIIQFRRRA